MLSGSRSGGSSEAHGGGTRRFEALQVRGHRGGVIQPHRSMAGLPWSAARLGRVVALGLLGVAGYAATLPAILAAWRWLFGWTRSWLGLRIMLGEQTLLLPGGAALRIPELSAITPQPSQQALAVATIATLAVLGLTLVFPRRLRPISSFLRLLVIVQASAILFFAASTEPFPYRISDYCLGLLSTGMIAMGVVPFLLGFVLYPLDIAFWRKMAVTVLIMGHFAVFTPFVTLVHAWLLLHTNVLVMPALFLGFGVLPFALVFLAMYGWAMSWPSELEQRRVPAPVHSA